MFDIAKGHVGALNETWTSDTVNVQYTKWLNGSVSTLLPAGRHWFCFTFHWFLPHFVVNKCQIYAWKSNGCNWEMFMGKMEMFPQSIASFRSKSNHIWQMVDFTYRKRWKKFHCCIGITFQCSIGGKYTFSAWTATNGGYDESQCINFNYMCKEFWKKTKIGMIKSFLIDWLIFISEKSSELPHIEISNCTSNKLFQKYESRIELRIQEFWIFNSVEHVFEYWVSWQRTQFHC